MAQAERDGVGSMAMVHASELVRFAGNLNTLIDGLSFGLEEIGRERRKLVIICELLFVDKLIVFISIIAVNRIL